MIVAFGRNQLANKTRSDIYRGLRSCGWPCPDTAWRAGALRVEFPRSQTSCKQRDEYRDEEWRGVPDAVVADAPSGTVTGRRLCGPASWLGNQPRPQRGKQGSHAQRSCWSGSRVPVSPYSKGNAIASHHEDTRISGDLARCGACSAAGVLTHCHRQQRGRQMSVCGPCSKRQATRRSSPGQPRHSPGHSQQHENPAVVLWAEETAISRRSPCLADHARRREPRATRQENGRCYAAGNFHARSCRCE